MTSSSRALALLALACLAPACTKDVEYSYEMAAPRVVEHTPGQRSPEEAAELEYHWLQAFEREGIGDEVDLEHDGELFEDQFELRLEDLYVELWHDGAAGARRLLEGVRDCDRYASIRFGKPLFIHPTEVHPPSEWAFEVRYLESDPHGRLAAELLRDHLREACDGEARELVREIVEEFGMVLRPVEEFAYADDPERRSPLVLVLSPRALERGEEVSDL